MRRILRAPNTGDGPTTPRLPSAAGETVTLLRSDTPELRSIVVGCRSSPSLSVRCRHLDGFNDEHFTPPRPSFELQPYFRASGVTIYDGDALDVLRDLPPGSVDAMEGEAA